MKKGHGGWAGRNGRPWLMDIAIHEAGHAVLAWATGRKILQISMVTDAQDAKFRTHPKRGVRAGCLVVAPLPSGLDLRDERHRVLAEREAMIDHLPSGCEDSLGSPAK